MVSWDATDRRQHDWQYKYYLWNNGISQVLIGPGDMDMPERYKAEEVDTDSRGCYLVYDNPYMKDGKLWRQAFIVDTGC